MKKLLFTLIFIFIPLVCHGAVVSWTANTESDLAGYRLYTSSSSGNYTFGEGNEIAAAVANDTSLTITNIPDGGMFYVLTAFDLGDNESSPSDEFYYDPPPEQVKQITVIFSQ